jgi:hypothetical protein
LGIWNGIIGISMNRKSATFERGIKYMQIMCEQKTPFNKQ